MLKKVFSTAMISVLFAAGAVFSQPAIEQSRSLKLEISGVGEIILEENDAEQLETTRLLLQRPGGARQVIDAFDGLLPANLLKHDLDADGSIEIIAVLRHPDGIDVMPFIYTDLNAFKRVFPAPDQEGNPLICREIFVSNHDGAPAVCARNQISFHDFGPPELYRLELFKLQKDQLLSVHQGFSEGDHFNILMNRGGYAMHNGQYLEALDLYNLAIASSSGEITTKAYIEALFSLGEARKYTKDFQGALELYQRIVVEFSENTHTDAAQREIELISSNLDNLDALSFYVDVLSNINCDRWEAALELLQNHPGARAGGKLQDRLLFTEGEVLTALNRVEEAIKVFQELKERFPESSIIENVDALLADMEETPEETDGL
jgi:tetratricopeptide (TPR) repeat protein